jgi:hypothetical protein
MTTRSKATTVKRSAPLQGLARVGYVVDGVLHLLIGILAIATIFGTEAKTDEHGALARIASQPFGDAVLWLTAAGFAGLTIFHVLDALLLRQAWDRLSSALRAVAYAALGFVTVEVALGHGTTDAPDTVSAAVLAQPAGAALLLLVAAAILLVGVRLVIKGATRRFTADLRMPGAPADTPILAIGAAGYIARGIAFCTVAVLFAIAAVTTNSSRAGGLDEALEQLAELPFGALVLAVIALGFIAFGAYCFVRARFARL